MTAPLTPDRLRRDVAEVLAEEPGSLTDDDNLIDRGLDSIRLMSLATRWREDGFEAGYLDLAQEPTLAAWRNLLGGTR
ncbi:phosphopantetheine-binding protein [Plantactinospora sp. KBS50]|uniref:phosphopantetheine-binding protein n=1 Tax=Plantactinospora sp. KBS50 TaxID=2024580 RepID=UPI000BAAC17E|nr:phosphopantetheine-binding protein [Plantactinospora sp. KBS50]ASW55469.1 acyl carrier protein [Plantactinospora sp. KBS50]